MELGICFEKGFPYFSEAIYTEDDANKCSKGMVLRDLVRLIADRIFSGLVGVLWHIKLQAYGRIIWKVDSTFMNLGWWDSCGNWKPEPRLGIGQGICCPEIRFEPTDECSGVDWVLRKKTIGTAAENQRDFSLIESSFPKPKWKILEKTLKLVIGDYRRDLSHWKAKDLWNRKKRLIKEGQRLYTDWYYSKV